MTNHSSYSHLTPYGIKLQQERSVKRWYVLALRNYRCTSLPKVYRELSELGFKTFQPLMPDGKTLAMNAVFVWSSFHELTEGDSPVVGETSRLNLCFRIDRCATPKKIITLSEDDIVQFKMICTSENTGQILISQAKSDKKRYELLKKQLDNAHPALIVDGPYKGFIGHYGRIDSAHRLAMKLDDYNAIATTAIPQHQTQILSFDEYVYLSNLKIAARVNALRMLRKENLLENLVIPDGLTAILEKGQTMEELAENLLPYPEKLVKDVMSKNGDFIGDFATFVYAVTKHFSELPEGERDKLAKNYLPDVLCSHAYNAFLNADGTWKIDHEHVLKLNQHLYELSNLWTFKQYQIPRICHRRPSSHSTDFRKILDVAKRKMTDTPVETVPVDTKMPKKLADLPEKFVTELTSPTLIHKYRHAPLARILSGPAEGIVGRFVEHVDNGKKLPRLFIEHTYNHAWLVTAPRAKRLEFLED